MKYFILIIILLILLICIKKKEGFQVYKKILERDFPDLIEDTSYVFFQPYACLNYEDIRI